MVDDVFLRNSASFSKCVDKVEGAPIEIHYIVVYYDQVITNK